MWREIRHSRLNALAGTYADPNDLSDEILRPPPKSFAAAAWSVALADVSMSLDNVLAVAGASREHPEIMIFGLVLSVALMGLAANIIAEYIERYRWIAYVGLIVIVFVAGRMIWEGANEVAPMVAPVVEEAVGSST